MTPSNSPQTPPSLSVGQSTHLICLAVLLVATGFVWHFIGSPSAVLFWIAVAAPVFHQIFVWISWRRELQTASERKAISFQVYLVVFFVLFGSRFVSLGVLAWVDRGSLQIPVIIQVGLTVLLAAPGAYAIYSVIRYFGFERAAGADHFDPRYRDMPLVKRGIFRFTSNGMYLFAFLLFWAIAISFNSQAATIVAAFSHAYIWVHYFATEKPDMDYLYNTLHDDRDLVG